MRILSKNKTGGVVTNTVMGIGGLLIGVIIILVITSTLIGSDLFDGGRLSTTANESYGPITEVATAFGNSTFLSPTCTIVSVYNDTDDEIISETNYTQTNCLIVFADGDDNFNGTDWRITSSTTYAGGDEYSSTYMQRNFTAGVDKISEKIPTILLLVAVVFLFGALVLLIRQANLMGVGGGGSL